MSRVPDYVTNSFVNDLLERALEEDVGTGDVTTLATVPPARQAIGRFDVREDAVIAGIWIAQQVFDAVDRSLSCEWRVADGDRVGAGDVIGLVQGPAASILTAERLALNLMQRMSGIATMTRRMADLLRPHGAVILDTRKTAPGLRPLDKWAVHIGGGENHRIGLFDMILIKDNHIAAAGGIGAAVRGAAAYREESGRDLQIELEVRTLDEVDEALTLDDIDVLLLDNMVRRGQDGSTDASVLVEAVRRIDGRVKTEASGNVTFDTVETIARAGVDYISCGALTHSVRALDVSLNVELVQ